MRKVYLIGFRGTSFRDERYSKEAALLRAGHVGIAFEGFEDSILGFHPTEEAIEQIGGEGAAIVWLKSKQPLDGTLQEDYPSFVRAAELAQQGARTTVWQFTVELPDDEFERIRQQAMAWYNERKVFAYAFPADEPLADRDNCATFLRRLGLPLLDPIGQIKDYARVLEQRGKTWEPKGK